MSHSQDLGTQPIGKLLRKQSIPAAAGFLVMSIYQIVDAYFVGNDIGTEALAAITIVTPLNFLISSVGMAVGIGGASIISRALGEDDRGRANLSFGNMVTLSVVFGLLFAIIGLLFAEPILIGFGATGKVLEPAVTYFNILLLGIPFLTLSMMSNNVIRAEGNARMAMLILMIPAVANIVLDYVFIRIFDWGMAGAAWATAIAYITSFLWAVYYFVSGKSEMRFKSNYLKPDPRTVKEIFSIGGITLVRQGTISLLALVINHTLGRYSGEVGIAIYGVVHRLSMFAFFPIIGIMQGFMPIAGFNYGAKKFQRVRQAITTSMYACASISAVLFLLIFSFSYQITDFFTDDSALLEASPFAMRMIFLGLPIVGLQLIGSAYFQSIGKALPALLLTLSKQVLLIPLVWLLPMIWDLDGVWYSFPVADVLSVTLTLLYLRREIRLNLSNGDLPQVQPH